MKKKRGQALVEFIIILPILFFLLLVVFDFGRIIMIQNRLENEMNNVVDELRENKNIKLIEETLKKNNKKTEIEVENNGNQTKIKLTEITDILTPGLNLILKSPYEVVVERFVINE